jgi:hypothetical protein
MRIASTLRDWRRKSLSILIGMTNTPFAASLHRAQA